MLEIKDLSIRYGKERNIIENFFLTVNKGEIVTIAGESGSGKTTVIRAVMGALPSGGKVTGGSIIFDGENLLDYTISQWRKLRGTNISMIFQDCGAALNPIQKIGTQYVRYIRLHSSMSKEEAWKLAREKLKSVNLYDVESIMESFPHQLSGGMRQRVGIAMAVTFDTKLLLADEPTSALDVTTQAQIVKQLMALRDEKQTSIIIVTHNIGVAAYMSDKIVVMQKGKAVDFGTRDEVINNPTSDYTKKLLSSVPEMEGKRFV